MIRAGNSFFWRTRFCCHLSTCMSIMPVVMAGEQLNVEKTLRYIFFPSRVILEKCNGNTFFTSIVYFNWQRCIIFDGGGGGKIFFLQIIKEQYKFLHTIQWKYLLIDIVLCQNLRNIAILLSLNRSSKKKVVLFRLKIYKSIYLALSCDMFHRPAKSLNLFSLFSLSQGTALFSNLFSVSVCHFSDGWTTMSWLPYHSLERPLPGLCRSTCEYPVLRCLRCPASHNQRDLLTRISSQLLIIIK